MADIVAMTLYGFGRDVSSFIKREEVERTFDHFFRAAVQPVERDLFLARIKEHLGKQLTSNYVQGYSAIQIRKII